MERKTKLKGDGMTYLNCVNDASWAYVLVGIEWEADGFTRISTGFCL